MKFENVMRVLIIATIAVGLGWCVASWSFQAERERFEAQNALLTKYASNSDKIVELQGGQIAKLERVIKGEHLQVTRLEQQLRSIRLQSMLLLPEELRHCRYGVIVSVSEDGGLISTPLRAEACIR